VCLLTLPAAGDALAEWCTFNRFWSDRFYYVCVCLISRRRKEKVRGEIAAKTVIVCYSYQMTLEHFVLHFRVNISKDKICTKEWGVILLARVGCCYTFRAISVGWVYKNGWGVGLWYNTVLIHWMGGGGVQHRAVCLDEERIWFCLRAAAISINKSVEMLLYL
jgi:hypothetical protein